MTDGQGQVPASPQALRRMFDKLEGHRESLQAARDAKHSERQQLIDYLAVADQVRVALDQFSEQLFGELVNALQTQLTRALVDVLDQPLQLKVERKLRGGGVTLGFYIERGGQREDIMKGQGGSVVNVLSVGLRILALAAVEEKAHRRFLVLDEQDCWLRPDLVPRLVHMVHEAGRQMGFQVLMISHHDPAMFKKYADRIYQCRPKSDGNQTQLLVEQVATTLVDSGEVG